MSNTPEPPQKIICVDYDGTLTAFGGVLIPMMMESRRQGARVIICTMRHPEEEDEGLSALRQDLDVEIFYTGRKAKIPFLEALGIHPDLFIDDRPSWLFQDSV